MGWASTIRSSASSRSSRRGRNVFPGGGPSTGHFYRANGSIVLRSPTTVTTVAFDLLVDDRNGTAACRMVGTATPAVLQRRGSPAAASGLRLASLPCGSPSPAGSRCASGTGTSTVGVWRTVLGGRPVVVKRLGAPGRARPAGAERPAALRLLAARRGRRHRAGRPRRDPGTAGAPAHLGRGGRRGHHPGPGLGRGRRQQRPVLRGLAGPVRRRRPGRARVAGARPAARPDGAGRAPRRLADPRPDHRRRRRRPPLAAPRRAARRARRAAAGGPARRPGPGEPARPRRRRRGRDRLGHASAAGRSEPTSGSSCSVRGRSSSRCSTPICSASRTGWRPATRPRRGRASPPYCTALSRAEWALARVAGGEGALAGKYRHPAVAPYLRSLQRQFPQIEELVGG